MANQQAQSMLSNVSSSLWQEVPVLVLFFVSFVLWRHLLPRQSQKDKAARSKKKVAKDEFDTSAGVPAVHSAPRHRASTATDGAASRELSPAATQAAEKQMMNLLANREFTRALNMFRDLERDGRDRGFRDEELFSAFVQSAIRVGKVDVVDRMLRTMIRNGVGPSTSFWQTTLKMLSSRKHFQACLSVHTAFSKKIPADKVAYSCLINAALDCGEPERALAMLERYQEADIEAKDHVLLFRTYVALNDVDGAERIFQKLGGEMTTLMANLLLLTCINAKKAERAAELLGELHKLDEGRAVDERIVDAVSYNTLIKGFAQSGQPKRCFDCLQEMKSKGIEPDDVTFGSLLDVCISGNDMASATEVVDSLMASDREIDTVVCTLFVKGFVRTGNLEKAVEIYREMTRRSRTQPDVVTYSVLIKAFVEAHDLKAALGLVDDMVKAGVQPDDIILTHLLEGCRHAGNQALGKKLFDDMLATGIKPSEYTLITLVKLYGRCGAHEEARELVETWEQKHGAKPSVIHFTCLMSGCLRTKEYEQAWKAYELMIAAGIAPDDTTLTTLLPGMVAAQMTERTLTLVTRALKGPKPASLPAETLNSALRLMLDGGARTRTHAGSIAQLMQQRGIAITARNVQRLAD